MLFVAHLGHDFDRLGKRFSFFVRAVDSGECFENVGDGHHPRQLAHVFATQAFRVAGAVHLFVVAGGNFGNLAQMFREGKLREHDQRLHDVLVDLVALLFGQRAARDGEIVELALVVQQFGDAHFESPGVVFGDPVACLPFENVFRLVG